MKVRFLADANLNRSVVSGVQRREPSLDFLTARAARLRGLNDSEVLSLAAQRQRVLVSHDVGTMPAYFRAFRSAGNASSGVFLIPQSLAVGAAIDELLVIWLVSEASEWETRLVLAAPLSDLRDFDGNASARGWRVEGTTFPRFSKRPDIRDSPTADTPALSTGH